MKFYIILTGEVTVNIPNPKIPHFSNRYKQYKLFLKEKEHREKIAALEKEFMTRKDKLTDVLENEGQAAFDALNR